MINNYETQEIKRFWEDLSQGLKIMPVDFIMFDKICRHIFNFAINVKDKE